MTIEEKKKKKRKTAVNHSTNNILQHMLNNEGLTENLRSKPMGHSNHCALRAPA